MHSSLESSPSDRVRRAHRLLILAAAAATLALVTLGGIVRVTDSGLGCPDWPLCHGRLIPPAEYHVLIEYSHRLTASVVGMLVLASASVAWWKLRDARRVLVPLTAAVPLVGLAAWLGRNAVLSELAPATVTLHLATAQAIFAMLLIAWVWSRPAQADDAESSGSGSVGDGRWFRFWTLAAAAATMVVLLSGSYAVGRGAGTICPSWPLCDSGLIPNVSLGWVHMAHRGLAGAAAVLVAWVAHLGWRRRRSSPAMGKISLLAVGLLVVQMAAGAANPWFDFVPAVRAIHLSLATALWGSLVVMAALSWRPALVGSSTAVSTSWRVIRDYVALMKPVIISLLLITALGGMFLATEGVPSLSLALLVLSGGTLAAGGAQALNHYLERDIDRLMSRTRHRPVADERVRPGSALLFGILLNIAAFVLLAGWVNLLSALLALSATLFYILVYTGWLKRTTPQNIVIGGAAGAVPPLVGWTAVTGSLDLPAVYLFAIIFFWTPPHFWALALLIKRDYARANVPMLPVVSGEAATARGIMLHLIILVTLTVLFFTIETVGLIYLTGAVALGAPFLVMAWRLLRSGGMRGARPLYLYSLAYLAGIFALVMVDSTIRL
ncbi:MAG: heme o synthase [Chloroflexi bacterium]|nr:heme o synthase [Chloroflexota bacterium]